ncbi:alpha-1,2-Mannosidase [Tolypocladium capitatum]|uniref:alpha-1,2-Mannosidase n=1 Tax=Tolypocladium capitatum TaxID=45235 RepID=A0A2K3QB64_9HYPO|nr:alpha-1,2-Mannosidase [Tolypocladium capitatum]
MMADNATSRRTGPAPTPAWPPTPPHAASSSHDLSGTSLRSASRMQTRRVASLTARCRPVHSTVQSGVTCLALWSPTYAEVGGAVEGRPSQLPPCLGRSLKGALMPMPPPYVLSNRTTCLVVLAPGLCSLYTTELSDLCLDRATPRREPLTLDTMRLRGTTSSILLLELAATALALPASKARDDWPAPPAANLTRANMVKAAFETAWQGYFKSAFPHDTLHPVSNGFEDDRNGWGATVVDALSTAVVMGEADIVGQMLDRIAQIDFTTTPNAGDGISVFETTIRYLGGLLAGYDLLKGPMNSLIADSSKVDVLLKQAMSLADSLSIAFDTPTGIPDPRIFLNPRGSLSGSSSNNIAEIGTLVLEWTHLSDLSGNNKYAQLTQKAESYLLNPTGSPEAWPGLVGNQVSVKDGTFLNSDGSWGAGADSFYEYLIKMYQYDSKSFAAYKDRWVLAADSTIAHLASHPTSRQDLTYLLTYSGQNTNPDMGHLATFAGGNFILGGAVLGVDKYKEFGLNLTKSAFNNYQQTPSGIGPEDFKWVDASLPAGGSNGPPPASQTDFYAKSGFYTTVNEYILRPETCESVYYAYRATGEQQYQDMAWAMFQAISNVTRAGSAYSSINDVTQTNGGGFADQMQSYFLAETFKYLYLTFAPDSEVQLQLQGVGNSSHFVFNTECQPLRVRV